MPYKDLEKKRATEKSRRKTFKYKEYHKNYHILNSPRMKDYYDKNFGISYETYNQMFEEQNGCCAICGKHQSNFKRRFAVDHCHITGKVRSLLCTTCNTHLGIYEKYKENFKVYLKEN